MGSDGDTDFVKHEFGESGVVGYIFTQIPANVDMQGQWNDPSLLLLPVPLIVDCWSLGPSR